MLGAGIDVEKALKSMGLKHSHSLFERAAALAARGLNLPDALLRAKLIDNYDYALLFAVDKAGSISSGLNHVSERRLSQLQRAESFKAGLILPKALIVIGLFAGVFIKIAAGAASPIEAVVSTGALALLFYLITFAALLLVSIDSRIWMSYLWPYPTLWKRMQWYKLAVEHFFFTSIVWQVSAGVSAGQACQNCSELLNSSRFTDSAIRASRAMAAGTAFSQALIENNLVLSNRMKQVLLISDKSGAHQAAIHKELMLQAESLKMKSNNFLKWTPRFFYLLALVFIAKMTLA